MIDKQKLNKKIIRWLRLDTRLNKAYGKGGWIVPNFTDSMDAILKEIVPELNWLNISRDGENKNYIVGLSMLNKSAFSGYPYFGKNESMPTAFCLALEKYIDSEGK